MQGFPENVMGVFEYIFKATDTPYIPGSPFLLAATLSFLALVTFLLVTNKADRDARYAPETAPQPDPDGLEQPPLASQEF